MTTSTLTRIRTRAEYMRGEISFHDYYMQLVTEETLRQVERCFSVDQLSKALAKDVHLNSIAIEKWYRLTINELEHRGNPLAAHGRFTSRIDLDDEVAAAAGETITRAVLVCIAKTAAKMLIAREAAIRAETRG